MFDVFLHEVHYNGLSIFVSELVVNQDCSDEALEYVSKYLQGADLELWKLEWGWHALHFFANFSELFHGLIEVIDVDEHVFV